MLAIVSLPLVSSRGAFRAMFHPNPPAYARQSKVDPGQPLFLTPYIESGQIAEGMLDCVELPPCKHFYTYTFYLYYIAHVTF